MLSLKPYRRAAVPLLAVHTPDPMAVLRLAIREATNGTTSPVLQWDCIHGIIPANNESTEIAAALNGGQDSAIATGNPIEALRALESMAGIGDADSKTIVVMFGLSGVLSDPSAGIPSQQALWNLRDVLSMSGDLCVLTVPIGWTNPFPDDIAIDDVALPTVADHQALAKRLATDAGLDAPSESQQVQIGDALLGLSPFAAEQAIALSLTKSGIDLESLRARKRQQIAETPGLSVYTGQERFDDLGGLSQAKTLFSAILNGKRKPGAIVFIDEIEKVMGGTGDTSGVSQSMLGYLLSYMQDSNATGTIFVGPPGAAKSAFAKAMGAEGDIPTVSLDMGGIKGSLVGESEGKMRTALSVISAISGERPFFVATCNAISVLPPELRRRFTVGTMFFDLPSESERNTIWEIYIAKYGLGTQELPDSDGWTGAEIKQCADIADRLGTTLVDAARFVIPVSISARDSISKLRFEASGRYLSASSDGVYICGPQQATATRKIKLEGSN